MEYYSALKRELIRKMGRLRESRMTASGGDCREGLSKKEKALMDTDISVVISGGRGYKETKKYCSKIKIK